jgi:hypothetical protein
VDVLTDALAVYRLTRLAITDDITEPVREQVYGWLSKRGYPHPVEVADVQKGTLPGSPRARFAYELLTCPWCLSAWIGAAAVLARAACPRVWDALARALAFSAVAGVITQASDRLET